MTIDETANYYYAAHIAQHPLDPFGFNIHWYEYPEPANHVLTPPIMVHWWSLAVWLCPEQPLVWKLWLLPFSLLFVYSLHVLLVRFAQGLEGPLLWMTVLSPTFLPGLNLMPDIPAAAVSLFALTVFLRAGDCDAQQPRRALVLAALAGLLGGAAMQTKYTGFLVPAIMLLHALVYRRFRLGLVAVCLAPLVFASWEIITHLKYGESHFLYQVRMGNNSLWNKVLLILPLFTILGGGAPVAALLGLAALGLQRWVVALAGGIALLGYVLAASVSATYTVQLTPNPLLFPSAGTYEGEFTLAFLIYGVMGLGVLGVLAAVIRRQVRAMQNRERDVLFLVLWLGLEVAGYFALTPFPAVRRVMGVVLVATLVIGRLATHTCREPGRQALVRGVVLAGVVLGIVFQWIDVCDAYAQKRAAEEAARLIREEDGGTIWYAGHWGFQYYAEQAGMQAVVPYQTEFRAGDWLVLPEKRIDQQKFKVDPEKTELIYEVKITDAIPVRTVSGYYGGATPLEPAGGTRLAVEIRRVTADYRAAP